MMKRTMGEKIVDPKFHPPNEIMVLMSGFCERRCLWNRLYLGWNTNVKDMSTGERSHVNMNAFERMAFFTESPCLWTCSKKIHTLR